MLFFPPGWYKCKVFALQILRRYHYLLLVQYFPSVRDKEPLPLLQAHLSIHCGHKDKEVLACRLWQSPAADLCGLGEANDTLTEGRLQITWLMGYVGVTKGGGEEVRRGKRRKEHKV
jgi:hypothetical protein